MCCPVLFAHPIPARCPPSSNHIIHRHILRCSRFKCQLFGFNWLLCPHLRSVLAIVSLPFILVWLLLLSCRKLWTWLNCQKNNLDSTNASLFLLPFRLVASILSVRAPSAFDCGTFSLVWVATYSARHEHTHDANVTHANWTHFCSATLWLSVSTQSCLLLLSGGSLCLRHLLLFIAKTSQKSIKVSDLLLKRLGG